MPSAGLSKDYREITAKREELRRHFLAKGVMDGTHKMDELIRKRMK